MRRQFLKAFAIVFGSLLFSLPIGLLAQAGTQSASSAVQAPAGGLVAATCGSCHDLSVALSKRGTVAEWRDTVARMIDRGAVISRQDADIIVAYLAEYYGPSVSPLPRPGGEGGTEGTERTANLPDAPGKDIFVSKCFQCHNQGFWTDLRQDRRAWEGVLYRMVGRRALWTEDEISTMAGYLARVRGPK